ncbi:MAG TPA: CRISPR-associated helicase Cas3', partial [Jatrophihabitantaceae bacterium]|nr:CRISPR-associated helicase Cas3' [Jatrophihabitantaceae bacterium]
MSAAALSVWAKSNRETGGWMPLWQHLDDSAAVAGQLWDEWLPAQVRHVISAALPDGQRDGRLLLRWLAGVHDVGKVSPVFAVQVPRAADAMRQQGLAMPQSFVERTLLRHELAGHLILSRWLKQNYEWDSMRSGPFAIVVGGHHGLPPDANQLNTARKHPEMLGTGLWTDVQDEYLSRAEVRLDVAARLPYWRGSQLAPTAQVLLTAAVIVSDWIASAEEFFPYDDCCTDQFRLERALAALALPRQWSARDNDVLGGFSRRFGLPDSAVPRPLQVAAVEIAHAADEPGLLIIEAPMGEGKTEAALLGAEVYAARTGAGGCFVALPTQATSNAMFNRVTSWLEHLGTIYPDETKSVTLAHGKAVLNEDYQGLVRAGRAASVSVDSADGSTAGDLIAHHWLSGRKKSGLASFVVGTIDQLLFAALKSRHLVLRHLAMASKIVVIDEAHAYDVYMSQYLDRVLEWLGAYRVPVIVLSATLPADRRREMVTAYDQGRHAGEVTERRSVRSGPAPRRHPELDGDIGYPVLVASTGTDAALIRTIPASPRSAQVQLVPIDDELSTLVAELSAALVDGGCAVVIRNTVARVQDTARHLRAALADTEVIVTHARFVATDRAANDLRLLELF